MSHQAFDKLLEDLQGRCLGMAGMVQQAVAMTSESLIKLDTVMAKKVLEGEQRIDDEDVEVERQAINLMILHHPTAADFRAVFGVVKINSDLERIGDCAVNVAQQVPRIIQARVPVPRDARLIAEAALKQVQDTVKCISSKDPKLADEICRADDVVDALNSQILQDLSAQMEVEPASVAGNLALIMVAKNFERIGDHCNNIAEDVVYLMRGEIVRHAHERQ
ncbi:MAG TPA: phosphate signaling complex protein PhoU [Phycisphaerae bacterium]|nr:phosphate signaling complex protein PhoU [Phycisphaerae bacterium]